jgi:hypothetical protein
VTGVERVLSPRGSAFLFPNQLESLHMKKMFQGDKGVFSAIMLISFFPITGSAQTNFTVTTPNFIYAVNGLPPTGAPGEFVQNSPTLTLVAGNNYIFTMQASSIHPMVIGTNFSTGNPEPLTFAYSNASPQDVFSGTITLSLPATNFPTNLYYQCDLHGFYGVINVLPPPTPTPPPQNIILSIAVGTNVVVTSTGTNTTYALVPKFNSNLVSGTWQPVPGFTNTFTNGTNVTSFGRLEPICGPNVFLRISQQPH